jgi:adenylosuccinate synthase
MMEGPLRNYVVDASDYNQAVDEAENAIIEGAQGFSLSINQGFYPYTTSRDCTTNQLLSDCGIPHGKFGIHIIGVCRTLPIRVANRPGGWSGPCYSDQREIQWSDIGIEPELTTVTKLPRRIFTFSETQIREAIRMNGVGSVFLNFCNYVTVSETWELIEKITRSGAPVRWLGWGPKETDVKAVNQPEVQLQEEMQL